VLVYYICKGELFPDLRPGIAGMFFPKRMDRSLSRATSYPNDTADLGSTVCHMVGQVREGVLNEIVRAIYVQFKSLI
jgi:hypothetical protein